MPLKQITKEVGEVIAVATFSNLEVILKILLLVVTIAYTVDKWWYNTKNR